MLERLEAHGPTVGAHETADVPRTPLEALSRWLTATGVRPGFTQAPLPRALVPVFTAYARARGWDLEVGDVLLGKALALAGCHRDGRRGYRVARDSAAALWRAVGGRPREKRKPSRPRVELPPAPRVTRHPTKPLRACDGRMWRSQRDAMASLGTTALYISRAVRYGTAVAGVHLRFATPAEVRAWRGEQEDWDGGIGSPS